MQYSEERVAFFHLNITDRPRRRKAVGAGGFHLNGPETPLREPPIVKRAFVAETWLRVLTAPNPPPPRASPLVHSGF
jgi:hypothetical protein